MNPDRFLVLAGGLCGAAGGALSAAAAHAGGGNVGTAALAGGGNVGTAASFLLMHAPAFLAIGLIGGERILRIGSWALLLGLLVFAGDLLMRDYAGTRLFPMAAPAGGLLLIAGWLIIAASAFTRRPDRA